MEEGDTADSKDALDDARARRVFKQLGHVVAAFRANDGVTEHHAFCTIALPSARHEEERSHREEC